MIDVTHQFFAQLEQIPISSIIAQVGWPGLVLWIVVRALDRIEHSLKGLSKALWMDLASRPHADEFVKQEARRMLAKMRDVPIDSSGDDK